MKQKYTKSKKANRYSGFHKEGNLSPMSIFRKDRRKHLQPSESPIFGYKLKYKQAIHIERKPFGVYVKTISHAQLA